jgi:sporulation protein YabP
MDGREARPQPGATLARGPAAPTAGGPGRHEVVLRAREQATITGVHHVTSFDDREIVLETELGTLTILGQNLQIRQLDLAQGTFWVDGTVDSLAYARDRTDRPGRRDRSGSVLGRLFR